MIQQSPQQERSSSVVVASVDAGADGHLGFTNNSGGRGSEELGIPYGTSS